MFAIVIAIIMMAIVTVLVKRTIQGVGVYRYHPDATFPSFLREINVFLRSGRNISLVHLHQGEYHGSWYMTTPVEVWSKTLWTRGRWALISWAEVQES